MQKTWRGDLLIVLAVLAVALVIWGIFHFTSSAGGVATVVTPTETRVLSLHEDGVYAFDGQNGMTVTVQVKDGAVRFAEANCPDRLCVKSGWLSQSGACAACVPAGITLRVEGESEVDAVAR